MRRKSGLRRSLLLDPSRRRISPKSRFRNRFLNFFTKFSGLKNVKKIFRLSVIGSFILIGMTGFLIFAIFSPYYELKTISVIRNNEIIPAEVIQNISSKFIGENMFFLQKEEIKNLLKEKFPEINNIQIKDKWPNKIELKIEFSTAKYNILNKESANFATITDNGIIISETSKTRLPTINILQYAKPFQIHKRLISKNWLDKINLAKNLLLDEVKLPIKEINLLMKAREAHFIMPGGGAIWVDLEQSIPQQIRKLILAEGKIKLYSKRFDHIDLRIPKQIFWKWQ